MIEITGEHSIRVYIEGEPESDFIEVQLTDLVLVIAIENGLRKKKRLSEMTEEASDEVDFARIEYPDDLKVVVNGEDVPAEEAMSYLGDFTVEAVKQALVKVILSSESYS